jgi:hypothetical protein
MTTNIRPLVPAAVNRLQAKGQALRVESQVEPEPAPRGMRVKARIQAGTYQKIEW